MNKVIYIHFLFFLLFHLSCKGQINEVARKKQGFSMEAKSGGWEQRNEKNYMSVFTTLTNNSADTIRYISMSCSWEMLYTTNNIHFSEHIKDCDKNVPKIVTIPPYSSEGEKCIWFETKDDTTLLKGLSFNVGFKYVPFTNYSNFHIDLQKLFKGADVVWSNTLALK